MKKTWKQAKLHDIEITFGGCIEEYKNFTDDRLVYVNIYNQIIEALESLPEEPNNYIKVAMVNQINKDKKIMNRIYSNFYD